MRDSIGQPKYETQQSSGSFHVAVYGKRRKA
jgi:hypothetical protein